MKNRETLLTYQVEPFDIAWPEMCKLFEGHYDEIALDKERIKLSPSHDRYKAMADLGMFHILTARSDGLLIGYWATFVYPHFHYDHDLMGFCDIYYLKPEFRKGRNGINLFKEAEKALKKRGCVKIFSATKLHGDLDNSKLFEWLGWKWVEKVYSKYIG